MSLADTQLRGWDVFNAGDMEELQQLIGEYGSAAERTIDDILHNEGATEIKKSISKLLPASGRNWAGKPRPARSAMPKAFSQDNEMLSVTVTARGKYRYLYFPDDGSNTRHHAGNLRFMKRGAENATSKVIDLCLGKLTGG